MIKSELIEAIKDAPDNAEVIIFYDAEVKEIIFDEAINTIIIYEMEYRK
jgi:hypothetical protein